MCIITFGDIHLLNGVSETLMFKIDCCNGSRKARIFVLSSEKNFQKVFLKSTVCSKCKKFVVVLEKTDFNGKVKRIKKSGIDAFIMYENYHWNILYEMLPIKTSAPRLAWTYYKTVNATTQIRRYMDESGNAGAKFICPLKESA